MSAPARPAGGDPSPRDGRERAHGGGVVELLRLEDFEQVLGEHVVLVFGLENAELGPHAASPRRFVAQSEGLQGFLGVVHRLVVVVVEQRQQGLGKAGQVPLSDAGLVAVGVATLPVDRAVDRTGVVAVHEGARSVVDGLSAERDVVRVHHAVDEAHHHPLGDEFGLCIDDRVEQTQGRVRRLGEVWVVACDGVVGQRAGARDVLPRREEGKCSDPQVAGGDPGQDGAGQGLLAIDGLSGGDDSERARGRDAQRVHALADHVLAQHGP